MKPAQLSAQLRQIAAKIDASKRPSKRLVAAAVKRVAAELTAGRYVDDPEFVADVREMMKAVAAGELPDGALFSEMNEDFFNLANETSIQVIIIDDGKNLGVNLGFEGSGEIEYMAPKGEFDPDAAANALLTGIRNILETSMESEEI